jgi:hypothetical protein
MEALRTQQMVVVMHLLRALDAISAAINEVNRFGEINEQNIEQLQEEIERVNNAGKHARTHVNRESGEPPGSEI